MKLYIATSKHIAARNIRGCMPFKYVFAGLPLSISLIIVLLAYGHAHANEGFVITDKGCKLWDSSFDESWSYTWSGDCKIGYANGYGEAVYFKDGKLFSKYTGNIIGGKRTGKGVQTWADGNRYEGDFVDGKRTGKGVQTWADGNRYEGDFVDGKESGKGVLTWAGGHRYEGDWVEGKQSGKGVMTWAGGICWEGSWVDGKSTTNGEYCHHNGERFEDNSVDNVKVEKDTDSGVGSFLGDLLGVVSSYHQGRGNTTKATQAEAIGAALSGDTARADAATSRLQAIASAEKAKKAQEQADKRAAQQAAQLQALQAAEAGRNNTSSSSGSNTPSQYVPAAETYQPTYQTSGNTYESNSGGISGGGAAGSAGKSTSKNAGKKEVISTSVTSHGYYDNGTYNGYRVIVRNTGNVKITCNVRISYSYASPSMSGGFVSDTDAVPVIMSPGGSDTAKVALRAANLSFKNYTVADCQKFMF